MHPSDPTDVYRYVDEIVYMYIIHTHTHTHTHAGDSPGAFCGVCGSLPVF